MTVFLNGAPYPVRDEVASPAYYPVTPREAGLRAGSVGKPTGHF